MAIIEDQKVKVKWVGANRKILESHGYTYTNLYDEIEIPIHHLSEKSHIKIRITCDLCGKESEKRRTDIDLKGKHFCNKKCYNNWVKTEEGSKYLSRPESSSLINTSCKLCNKEFLKKPSEFTGHGNHFCSRSCVAKYKSLYSNPNPKKNKIKVNCELCTKKFEVNESKVKNNKWLFCSRDCYAKFRSEKLKGDKIHNYQGKISSCDNCGIDTKVTKYYLENRKNVFCSQPCYYEFRSKHYVGENHHNFGTKVTGERLENMRLITAKRIANGEFPHTNTSIQIKINNLSNKLNMGFKEEIQFKYYVLDFYDKDTNLAIEIMGDYWHSNPLKYPEYKDLHDIQKNGVRRDKSKRTYLKKFHNIDILYLWEYDINNNLRLCEELLKKYVSQNGKLEEYNSFNYTLTNERLLLNEELIKPFFLRSNTPLQVC